MKTAAAIIKKLALSPRQLFLADGLGAALSATMLLAVLVQFEVFFGLSESVARKLAILPCVFAVYSLCCYLLAPRRAGIFLRLIAALNLLYCALTLLLTVYLYDTLTAYGVAYFLSEKLVIVPLAIVELNVARHTEQTLPS